MKTPSRPTTILCLCFLFLSLAAVPGRAQTYTILHTFGTNAMGVHPRAPLVQGPDGTFYGTTAEGGIANRGQVFKVNPDGSGYTALKDFTGANGAQPEAGLVLSGTTLYGSTVGGGTNDNGTVFKVNTDGTGFTVLKEFSESADGANPYGTLVLSGSTLYGTTQNGGDFGFGTVFKVDVNGTGFAVLKHFTWYDGGNPHGALVLSGTTLYGTTIYGSSSGNGTIFSLNTDGSGFTVIKEFDGSVDGSMPYAGVCLSEGVLYGTTQWGGGYGNGTIYRLNTDGSEFTVLKEFNYSECASAQGELVISGMTLYGTGGAGGAALGGTVFRINTNGSDFTVLKDFTDPAEGTHPFGGLLLAGSTLYATAADGGACNFGTVFKIESDGSAFTVLTNFVGGDGAIPMGLAFSGTAFYGTTDSGGSFGKGTIYTINTDGSAYAILQEFGGTEDANPTVELADANLFGTSVRGGDSGYGFVFRMNIDGNGFSVLKGFWGSDGAWPYGGVVASGAALYGTTLRGGSNNLGLVFTMNTNGSDFVVLKDFAGSDGDSPMARLVLSGTTLYGTTQGGGDGFGTVFRINTDGNGFMVLKRFTGLDGASPLAGLVLSNSTLYGTTASGGTSGNGIVFKVNTDGSGFLVLKYFSDNDGANPRSQLVLSGSTLYGSTAWGGFFGQGTLFQIGTDGTDFTVLKHFTGSDGACPQAGLILSGTTLFGTTTEGGQLYSGVLFSLSPGLPVIALQPQSQTVSAGDIVDFRVEATGWPTPSFQWLRDGAVLDDGGNISGAHSAILTISNALGGDGGRPYSVIISNSYGSVTSLVATLNVIIQPPVITTQPVSHTTNFGATVAFNVTVSGTPPLAYQWLKNGGALTDTERIVGANSPTLTLSNVFGGDAGDYSINVSNAAGSVTGLVATLTVIEPLITAQPISRTVTVGDNPVINVAAIGTMPLNYQWLRDGVRLTDGGTVTGSQSSSLALSHVLGLDAGNYSAIVSNSYGSVTSLVATLTVNHAIADAFAPTLNSGVSCLAETANKKILIGGSFSLLDGSAHTGLALLYADGAPDHAFNPGIGPVQGIAVQPDGQILVVGSFTIVQGSTARNICRLTPGGKLDTAFDAGANDSITCLALQPNGQIVVGCYPTCFASAPRTVVRLNADGSLDASFTAEPDSVVNCVALQPDGKILIAGGFDNVNGQPRNRVARLNTDGTLDSSFDPSPNPMPGAHGAAYAMALQPDGKVLVGGWPIFGEGTQMRANLARLNTDGKLDVGFNPDVNDGVATIALQRDGKILLGGHFTAVSGVPRTNLARLHSNGALDTSFDPTANGQARTFLEQSDGAILVGGYFTVLAGQPRAYIGRLVVYEPPQPVISPAAQTVEAGKPVHLVVHDSGFPVPAWQWYFAGLPLSAATNGVLNLPSVGLGDAGTYAVTASNIAGVSTSGLATLSVVASVERRMVPGLVLTGDVGSSLHLEYSDALGPLASWGPLETVALINSPQNFFDLSTPLPPQRFYRAWQTTVPTNPPSLGLNMVPAITLTGSPGDSIRVDGINQFGPIAAWFALDTVTLTNTSQLYFDVTAPGQPPRLYRLVPVP